MFTLHMVYYFQKYFDFFGNYIFIRSADDGCIWMGGLTIKKKTCELCETIGLRYKTLYRIQFSSDASADTATIWSQLSRKAVAPRSQWTSGTGTSVGLKDWKRTNLTVYFCFKSCLRPIVRVPCPLPPGHQ